MPKTPGCHWHQKMAVWHFLHADTTSAVVHSNMGHEHRSPPWARLRPALEPIRKRCCEAPSTPDAKVSGDRDISRAFSTPESCVRGSWKQRDRAFASKSTWKRFNGLKNGHFRETPNNRENSAALQDLARWVKNVWCMIPSATVNKAVKKYEISNAMDRPKVEKLWAFGSYDASDSEALSNHNFGRLDEERRVRRLRRLLYRHIKRTRNKGWLFQLKRRLISLSKHNNRVCIIIDGIVLPTFLFSFLSGEIRVHVTIK